MKRRKRIASKVVTIDAASHNIPGVWVFHRFLSLRELRRLQRGGKVRK